MHGKVANRTNPQESRICPRTLGEQSLDDGEGFQFQVGESLLKEFALSHTPADVLRELVQNQYDAGGDSMDLAFGRDHLTVRGNGRGIDSQGWKRLGVMLGTGRLRDL